MIKNFKTWFIAAAIRAIKTFAQAFIAVIPAGALFLGSINWGMALSSAALAAILSFATSLAGLPEVKDTVVEAEDSTVEEE